MTCYCNLIREIIKSIPEDIDFDFDNITRKAHDDMMHPPGVDYKSKELLK
jgi:hypothetical protein